MERAHRGDKRAVAGAREPPHERVAMSLLFNPNPSTPALKGWKATHRVKKNAHRYSFVADR